MSVSSRPTLIEEIRHATHGKLTLEQIKGDLAAIEAQGATVTYDPKHGEIVFTTPPLIHNYFKCDLGAYEIRLLVSHLYSAFNNRFFGEEHFSTGYGINTISHGQPTHPLIRSDRRSRGGHAGLCEGGAARAIRQGLISGRLDMFYDSVTGLLCSHRSGMGAFVKNTSRCLECNEPSPIVCVLCGGGFCPNHIAVVNINPALNQHICQNCDPTRAYAKAYPEMYREFNK